MKGLCDLHEHAFFYDLATCLEFIDCMIYLLIKKKLECSVDLGIKNTLFLM